MEYIAQIQEIARLAGAEAMKYFNHIKENAVSCKSTPKDIVSTADKAVESLIASEIQKRFPGHGMYGEEYGRRDLIRRSAGWSTRSTAHSRSCTVIRSSAFRSR